VPHAPASTPVLTTHRRDAGLVRVVGPWALAANIISMIIGAGIFTVPAALAASVGPYAPLAFLACGLGVSAVAVCFAEGGSRVPTSGGVYGFIEAAFGPMTGYVAGTLLWVGCLLACAGVTAALGDVVASILPPTPSVVVRGVTIVATVGAIAWVNIAGVRQGARLVAATTILKLAPLALFIMVGIGAFNGANFSQPVHSDSHGLGRALILALFAFIGMETSLCASGEVREPNRTIPRALAIAMFTTMAIYVAIQVAAQGTLGPALASSKIPLADAMATIHPGLRVVMIVGTAISMLGWLGSDILGTPRQLFAFGRDGLLPRTLGRVHSRTHTPYIAILAYAGIAVVLALTGTFAELAAISTLAIAALYTAGCAAGWALRRHNVALAGPPLNFRFLGIATFVGIGSMSLLILMCTPKEIMGLIGLVAVSMVAFHLQTHRAFVRN
jgi:basic amino acid/polyamine antiporter, APA family